jgi:hypothetical protein
MKRIIIFFVLAFLNTVGLFAQTDFFYTANGKETFKVRKDRIVIRATPVENVNALSALSTHTALLSTHMVGYDMLIATIDTLNSTLEDLRQVSNIADATFALEYADGTVQMPTNRIFVQFKEGQTPENVFNFLGLRESIKAIELINEFDGIYMITLNVRLDDILRICRDLFRSNLVVFAEPVFIREARRFNPLFPQQWGLRNTGQSGGTSGIDINAMQAWNITRGNSQIRVAVIDEGVDLMHLDLRDNLLPGFDATVNPSSGANGSPHANNAHGTLCVGVIAALDNNIGMVGVAPNVRIMPVRIAFDRFDNGSWTTQDSWIVNGIRHAWQTAQADVLNNSWGGGSQSATIDAEINAALTQGRSGRGSVVIFASGNGNASSVSYPASLPNVIAVGAIDRNGRRAGFSNFGTNLDVVAPGVGIITTSINNSYVTVDGTSLAAPHVSGIAALILSVRPDLRQDQVRHAIESTARKLPGYTFNIQKQNGSWNNEVGHGLVNAYAAVYSVVPRIEGPSLICGNTSASYSVSNLPSGAQVTWSSSSNIVINQSGVAARHSSISGVTQPGWVTATITIPGTQPVVLTQNITVGTIPNANHISTLYNGGSVFYGNCTNEDYITYHGSILQTGNSHGITAGGWNSFYNGGVNVTTFESPPLVLTTAAKMSVMQAWMVQTQVALMNQCGWSDWKTITYYPNSPCGGDFCPCNCVCCWVAPCWECGGYNNCSFCPCSGGLGFLVHPNPANDEFTIEFFDHIFSNQRQTFSVKLLDNTGRTHRQTSFTHSRGDGKRQPIKFNVSNLLEGTYFLHIEGNGEVHKKQIIIKRN